MAGDTNQLIKNYKRSADEIAASAKASQLQYYKNKAVGSAAALPRGSARSDGSVAPAP
jgi:hypothetical protein